MVFGFDGEVYIIDLCYNVSCRCRFPYASYAKREGGRVSTKRAPSYIMVVNVHHPVQWFNKTAFADICGMIGQCQLMTFSLICFSWIG